MMASKSDKSPAPEASKRKLTMPAPKGAASGAGTSSKPSRRTSPPTKVSSRSPSSTQKKPSPDRRAPKLSSSRASTSPDKLQQQRGPRSLDPESRLKAVQEDLKKAMERLAMVEEEKAKVVEELGGTKILAEEANQKLQEVMVAHRKELESVDAEKSHVIELQKAAAEAGKVEEEWQKKLEGIEKQRLDDAATLRSVVDELEKAKRELADAVNVKNSAVNHASDVARSAKVNTQKVELLNGEVGRLQGLLSTELENKAPEAVELIAKLEAELSELRIEQERAKEAEEKTVLLQNMVKKLRADVASARKAEADAAADATDWMEKAKALETRMEEAMKTDQLKGDSLVLLTRELDAVSALLQDRESANSALKDAIAAMGNELALQKMDFEECRHCLDDARREVADMRMEVQMLRSKMEAAEEEKLEAIGKERSALLLLESLSDERNMLLKDLEASREEGEDVKRAMEELASSLHDALSESRAAQERILDQQAAMDGLQAQVEELKSSLKNIRESYEVKLDEANYNIVCLHKTIERLKLQGNDILEDFHGNSISEQEAKGDDQLQESVRSFEYKVSEASHVFKEDEKAWNTKMEEGLSDKELELRNVMAENNELLFREQAALEKIKELTSLLAEVRPKDASSTILVPPRSVRTNNSSKTARRSYELIKASPEELDAEGNVMHDADEQETAVATAEVARVVNRSKAAEHNAVKHREYDAESAESDAGSLADDNLLAPKVQSLDIMNNGSTTPPEERQKKQHLLKKFGRVFKKRNNHY